MDIGEVCSARVGISSRTKSAASRSSTICSVSSSSSVWVGRRRLWRRKMTSSKLECSARSSMEYPTYQSLPSLPSMSEMAVWAATTSARPFSVVTGDSLRAWRSEPRVYQGVGSGRDRVGSSGALEREEPDGMEAAAHPEQHLAQVQVRFDLHQLVEDPADDEVGVRLEVVVDLEHLEIGVESAGRHPGPERERLDAVRP